MLLGTSYTYLWLCYCTGQFAFIPQSRLNFVNFPNHTKFIFVYEYRVSTKPHTLFALLCISALYPNLTHILFTERVFEEVTSADSHIFKCILFSSSVFLCRTFLPECFIRSENHVTGNCSLLLFSAGKGKNHIRTGHEGPEGE